MSVTGLQSDSITTWWKCITGICSNQEKYVEELKQFTVFSSMYFSH